MSDETPSSPKKVVKSEATPRVRRISTPRPKKAAKSAAATEPALPVTKMPAAPELTEVAMEPTGVPPVSPDQAEAAWPEPEAATTGGEPISGESTKRKRRRRKGKGGQGGGNPNGAPTSEEEFTPNTTTEQRTQESPQEPRQRPAPAPQSPQQQAPRPKVDPELLTKMAWKIYLAEVSEEGVALIGDNDAKDLSRRCFRLAEIFIEEQQRRR